MVFKLCNDNDLRGWEDSVDGCIYLRLEEKRFEFVHIVKVEEIPHRFIHSDWRLHSDFCFPKEWE